MKNSSYKYSMKLFPYFTGTFLSALITFSVLEILDNSAINWVLLTIALIAMALVSSLWALVLVIIYKISITEKGIKGFNVWGMYKHADWSEINKVKPINILGMKFWRVYTSFHKRPLWIPMFIKNIDNFIMMVCELCPSGNAFRNKLESKNG